MRAKIALKNEKVIPFGGIYYVMDEIDRLGICSQIDSHLGLRIKNFGYQYSDIITSLFHIYYCGGDHIEDIGKHLGEYLEYKPGVRIPSPDTVLRGIKELSTENITYTSDQGKEYEYNTSDHLNKLLLKLLLKTGQLKKNSLHDLDYDNQFIPAEKYDTLYSYKKKRGYFPGIATISEHIVTVENRAANANVRFHQEDTLERCYSRLEAEGITIHRSRMDCGSFSESIVRTVANHSLKFYIRAGKYQSLYNTVARLENWKKVEINYQKYEVTSIFFTSFMEDRHYRLVIQRQKRQDGEADLFEGEFTYRCILTNDWELTEKEVIEYYNARGTSEKTFDVMNNDFGWSKLPCSFLKENTVFLLLTAMAKNFYTYLVGKVSETFEDIEPVSRIKKFIFRFISVPAKWIRSGRRWVLNIYTNKPYDRLWNG